MLGPAGPCLNRVSTDGKRLAHPAFADRGGIRVGPYP